MSSSSKPIVEMDKVSFFYRDTPTPAVNEASFVLFPHSRVLLLGHNGSGKSTLLALLAGQRRATSGRVRVLQRDPFEDTRMAEHIALIGAPWPAEAYFATTVDRITSTTTQHLTRRNALSKTLNLSLASYVDHMSSGEKRRVQILHGMIRPATVYLLDECGTDVDVAERYTLMRMMRAECEDRGGCCVYATHIFDYMRDWATHVIYVNAGRVSSSVSVTELDVRLEEYALQRMLQSSAVNATRTHFSETTAATTREDGTSYYTKDNNIDDAGTGCVNVAASASDASLQPPRLPSHPQANNDDLHLLSTDVNWEAEIDCSVYSSTTTSSNNADDTENCPRVVHLPSDLSRQSHAHAISCHKLNYKNVFRGLSFEIYRGERVLLCGCNGSGKSTLLNMMGGKQFFDNRDGALVMLGKRCYDDMLLNRLVAYGGDWWAGPPEGEVHVREMLTVDTTRAARLQSLLAVDMDWNVQCISAGERKRVQLLLHLLHDKPIVLLDEATADLDVDQRHRLLRFLYEDSVLRGVTVVYATHIFGGLNGWATATVLLDRTTCGVHAVWRGCNGDDMSMHRLTEELMHLKSRELRQMERCDGCAHAT